MLIILAASLPSQAQANAATESTTLQACFGMQLARVSSARSCRARFALDDHRDLCVPEGRWQDYLSGRNTTLCGAWTGRWRAAERRRNRAGVREEGDTERFRFVASALPAVSVTEPSSLGTRALRAIERARERLSRKLAPHDSMGILRPLLVGESVPEGKGAVLFKLGFVHLLTATGIHLYALASGVEGLARVTLSRLAIPASSGVAIARLLSLLAWVHAWALCGARPGMLRPAAIVVLRTAARAAGFRWSRWAPLGCALALDLAVACARAALGMTGAWAPGRWVYALAIGGGMVAAQAWPGHVALAVGSWALPGLWEAWHDGRIAPLTPIISLVTLPAYTTVLYPACLFSEAIRALGAEAGADRLLDLLARGSDVVTRAFVRAALTLPSLWIVPRWAFAGGVFAALLLALPRLCASGNDGARRLRTRSIAFALLACVVARGLLWRSSEESPPPLASEVVQLDVGQGDAALVLWPGELPGLWRAGLVDAGSEQSLSEAAWLELFADRGITGLEFVALTHLDEDHAGGLRRLARLSPIHCATSAGVQLESEKGAELADLAREVGFRLGDWSSGCFPFPSLGPAHASDTRNNAGMSAVIVPLAGERNWINAGDADTAEESRLLAWAASATPARGRILKITHHGSRYSSSEADLRRLSPSEAWVSVGRGNRYGHPTQIVLERLRRLGIPLRRTDRDGAISSGR